MKRKIILLFILGIQTVFSQEYKKPLISAIKTEDLKKDLYQMAGDHFNGREAGTLDELKVSVWLAAKAKEAGMTPAGDDGTFFQFFDLYRHQVTPQTKVSVGQKSYKLWNEVLVAETTNIKVDAPLLYLDAFSAKEPASAGVKGKAVVILASKEGMSDNISLFDRRYPGFVKQKYYEQLAHKGAAALIIVADKQGEESWSQVEPQMERGVYGIEGYRDKIPVPARMPVFWLHNDQLEFLKSTKENLKAEVVSETYKYPSVNVIGKIEGTDALLRNEYVLFSGHHDHDGIRQKYGQDSIYNGADDNASMCTAMLAIARAYKKQPGKRTALFVFHGAEERGLLGSEWYASHPTVPVNAITAVLNGDMIGRNDVNQAALLGSAAPHQNSLDLVQIAFKANNEGPKFELDKLWDRPEHPEYFYFRSDHISYVNKNIPAVFFTSVLHNEYHTPMDESENIDYVKLHKMTEWIYRTGWILSNQANRPQILQKGKTE